MKRSSTPFGVIFDTLCVNVKELLAPGGPVIVGIDGRCASGKTTLAERLAARFHAPVIHMDQFFLRPHMHTPERLSQPGGNVDKERFYEEVMAPLCAGLPCTYRPFDCHRGELTEPIKIPESYVYIIEGTYSLCPELWRHYDLRVFLTVESEEQLRRIEKRNGPQGAETFRARWIPLEEAYFNAFPIHRDCDMVIDTTHLF